VSKKTPAPRGAAKRIERASQAPARRRGRPGKSELEAALDAARARYLAMALDYFGEFLRARGAKNPRTLLKAAIAEKLHKSPKTVEDLLDPNRRRKRRP
jgi:hypothetical protein